MRNSLLVLAAAAALLCACSDDGGSSSEADVDAGLSEDTTDTTDVADGSGAADVSDAGSDADANTDAEPDVEEDASLCPGSLLCLDPVSGNPTVRVCREAGLPEGTTCERMNGVACCVEPFRCESDLDCGIAQGEGSEDFCLDPRFPCVCDVPTGTCSTFVCTADSECPEAESCVGGRCELVADEVSVGARFLTRDILAAAGTSIPLHAVAVMLERPSRTLPDAALEFTVESGAASFDAETRTLTLDDDAREGDGGVVIVRAVDNPADAGDQLRFDVADPSQAGLSVYVIDEYTREPIAEATIVVGETETTTSVSGRADLTGEGPWDVHVFVDGYAYVSMLGASGDRLVIPVPRDVRASIAAPSPDCTALDDDYTATLQSENCGGVGEPECLCFQLENVDVVVGTPTFNNVAGPGDTQVTISGFSLGNSLLDLNFDIILGPAIDRVLGAPINQDAEVPSGVTLEFNGDALIGSFIATAPVGERMMWSIGGRVALSDILRDVIGSIGGDLNIGAILATVLPFFDNFYSDIAGPLELAAAGTFPERDPGLALDIPTQRTVLVDVPALPELEAGWADTMVVLGGVLVPGEGFLPLGITAGSDSLELSNADGVVDGDNDNDTDEIEPLRMAMAPIHGPARTNDSRYMFAAVALVLNEDANAPREASAGIIRLLEPGAPLPQVVSFDGDFPAFALGSTWNADTRSLSIETSDTDSEMHRVVFRDSADHLWIAYVPSGQTEFTLTTPPAGFEDRAAAARVNVVGVNTTGENLGDLTGGRARSLADLYEAIESFSIVGL